LITHFTKNLLLVFLGFFIFFVGGEVVSRAYMNIFKPLHRPSSIKSMLWEPTPGADVTIDGVNYKVNSQGLRDYEYALEKPEGVYRIAVIGDSITWGEGVGEEDTYPKIIEREMNKNRKKKIEVLRFGILGIGMRQYFSILKEKVLKYSPDVVVLGYCLNDIRFYRIYDKPMLMWFLQHSYFADFIVVKTGELIRTLQFLGGVETVDSYYAKHIKMYEEKEKLLRLQTILRNMKRLSDDNDVKFAVAVFPFKQQFEKRIVLKAQKIVSDICVKEDILVFDLIDQLKKYDKKRLYLKGDAVHFSAYGNKSVAKVLLQFLYSLDFMPAPG